MTLNKLNISLRVLIGAMIMILVSCSDDLPTREESFVPDPNAIQVFFPEDNESDLKVAIDETEVTVTLKRVNSSAAASVNLAIIDSSNVFTYPEKVDFAAGEAEATITISFPSLNYFSKYMLDIEIDEAVTNPYVNNGGTTNFRLYVTQTDWAKYSDGTFGSVFFDSSWAQVLEYSDILKRYRFANLYAKDYHYEFTWDGGSEFTPIPEKVETGYVHATYGMVSTTTDVELSGYDAATKSFTFTKKWTVSAGSFGVFADSYTMN